MGLGSSVSVSSGHAPVDSGGHRARTLSIMMLVPGVPPFLLSFSAFLRHLLSLPTEPGPAGENIEEERAGARPETGMADSEATIPSSQG